MLKKKNDKHEVWELLYYYEKNNLFSSGLFFFDIEKSHLYTTSSK